MTGSFSGVGSALDADPSDNPDEAVV